MFSLTNVDFISVGNHTQQAMDVHGGKTVAESTIQHIFVYSLAVNHSWKNVLFFREPNQNFPPPILLNFPPFLYVFLYFIGKSYFQMSKFPENHVPEFPIFQAWQLTVRMSMFG